MYNPKSTKAEEFISHEEILATLKYADENKNNVALIDEILAKARLEKGLTHREVLVLLDCEIPAKAGRLLDYTVFDKNTEKKYTSGHSKRGVL